jgi:DNA-binding MarR family transcriptional regulator
MVFGYEELTRNFGRIWPIHVEQFTQMLITLRHEFGGDLDRMLVLAVIGLRTLPPHRAEGLSYTEFQAGRALERPSPINIQSIAESSGIPRETARRKVRELEADGWIEQTEGGYLAVSAQAREELTPATEATIRYLLAIGAACAAAAAPDPD